MHCLHGGYNLHRFSDALGLVNIEIQLYIYLYFQVHLSQLILISVLLSYFWFLYACVKVC